MRAAEQDRPDVARRRCLWRLWQRFMDGTAFVFLDETGANTKMTRFYARAPKGERLVDSIPHGHWKTTTFVAGLRTTGIIAPLVLDGPMNGEAFLAYAEQMLAPSLRPGDVLVMDNLSAHKVAGVEDAVRAVGASILYLPAYSPDLNPIEQVFAKIKTYLRKAAARTQDALEQAIKSALKTFTQEELTHYIAHAGYGID